MEFNISETSPTCPNRKKERVMSPEQGMDGFATELEHAMEIGSGCVG